MWVSFRKEDSLQNDITTNDLLSNVDVFADIANVNLFDGEEVIRPEELVAVPLDASYKDLEGKHHKLFRDVLMRANHLGGCIAFVGYENQTEINRSMPTRDMGYAYACYAKQIKDIVAQNNAEKNSAYAKVLHEEQKLMPVATFVLYYGEEEWTAPLSLMDILYIPEEEKQFWSGLITDYPIRVIHMVGQSEEVRKKYRSDYGVVADYLAYYKDKKMLLSKFFSDTRRLSHVEQVLDMLDAFSDDARFEIVKKKFLECEKKEANSNMCLLMDIIEERSVERGLQKGMEKGMERKLVTQICKKLLKGKSVVLIADELEENVDVVQHIVDVAEEYAPTYEIEAIYKSLQMLDACEAVV